MAARSTETLYIFDSRPLVSGASRRRKRARLEPEAERSPSQWFAWRSPSRTDEKLLHLGRGLSGRRSLFPEHRGESLQHEDALAQAELLDSVRDAAGILLG